MRKQGRIVRWEAERGFGFIRSADTVGDLFFHKQDFRSAAPPRQGLDVSFEEIHVGGKGPRAMSVQATSAEAVPMTRGHDAPPAARRGRAHAAPLQATRHRGQSRRQAAHSGGTSTVSTVLALTLMVAWASAMIWGIAMARLPPMTWAMALLLNLATFFVYWVDKYAAQRQQWRTPENTLHLLALLGGWPGAWMAQRLLRHKSSKTAFLTVYWFTVTLHGMALVGWVFGPQLSSMLLNT